MYVCVFNVIARKNESKLLSKDISCKCECRLTTIALLIADSIINASSY